MKTIIITGIALITMALTTSPVAAQDHQHHENHEQMMQMMEVPEVRAMMMERIAEDPDMHREMMNHMRKAMMDNMQQMDHAAMMAQMRQRMDDPEMKERMQEHMKIMQSMMEDKQMDHSRMMEMMQDSPMMEMHMRCMQMMYGDDMEGVDAESDDHEQHH